MRLDTSDIADLQPVIAAAVRATLAEIAASEAKLGNDRLGYTESQAAQLLGIAKHVLADARRRGEIFARKCGKAYLYDRRELLRYLADGGGA